MKSEVLNLGKHFLTIDSTIPFELYNPITQTTINKASGRWVIDCWKLLTKEYFKNNPQFVLELRYDETLLVGKNKIEWHITDIDIGSIQSEYQLVTVANLDTSGLAEEATLQNVAKEKTLQTVGKEVTLKTVAKEETLKKLNVNVTKLFSTFASITELNVSHYFKKNTFFIHGNEAFKADSDCSVRLASSGNLFGTGFFTKIGGNPQGLLGGKLGTSSETDYFYIGEKIG